MSKAFGCLASDESTQLWPATPSQMPQSFNQPSHLLPQSTTAQHRLLTAMARLSTTAENILRIGPNNSRCSGRAKGARQG